MKLISLSLLVVTLALAQNNSVYPSQITLGAAQPAGVTSVTAQTVGANGQGAYYYWVIANWPIGQTQAASSQISNAPNTLTSGYYVRVSWNLIGAVSYDVLRTTTPNLPNTCTCAVATGNTSGVVLDQGGALSSYNYAPAGNAQATITLNNKDYPTPALLSVPLIKGTGGAPSPGITNGVYVSDGAGGWTSTGCTWSPSTYAISCPTTVPLIVAGTCVASSSVSPPLNGVAEFCDSGNSNHLSVLPYGGSVIDLEGTVGLNGVLKYIAGVPGAIGTSSTNCVHEDGSSGACGGGSGSGWPVGSTPSLSPATGTYTSTQGATASCSHGTAYYCLGTLGSACASSAAVTAYSTAVSVATSARFQAQCRDNGYDPGPLGYSDITIGAPVMDVCFDFRASYQSGVVIDPACAQGTGQGGYVDPTPGYFPVSRTINGTAINFGWPSGLWASTGLDNPTTSPAQFAGISYGDSVFLVQLPSAGLHLKIRLALGYWGATSENISLTVSDGSSSYPWAAGTPLFTASGTTSGTGGQYLDATSVVRSSPADWLANNAYQSVVMTGDTLHFKSNVLNTPIAFIEITQ